MWWGRRGCDRRADRLAPSASSSASSSTPTPAATPPPPPANFDTVEFRNQYGLGLINAISAYEAGATGLGILVAVVDTGVELADSEFDGTGTGANQIHPASTDIVSNRTANDVDGHGTGVAGVIAAKKDDVVMHGVAFQSTILAIRADSVGSCEADGGEGCTFSDSATAAAIDHAVANGARIINLSLGRDAELGDDASRTFAAMRRAADAGVLLVVAAGNQDEEETEPDASPGFPATFVNDLEADGFAVAVGSVGSAKEISSFSNRAQGAENFYLVAPGEQIVAPGVGPDYFRFSGTSFAAPHVAGALALMLQAFPNLAGNTALQILFDTAEDLGDPGADSTYGRGLIDLAEAFKPQGTTTTALFGAERVPVALVLSEPGGAFGDWVFDSGLFDGAVMRDRYDRAYRFEAGEAPGDGGRNALSAFETAAQSSLNRVSVTRAGSTEVTLRHGQDRVQALTNLPEELYQGDMGVSLRFIAGDLTLEAGRGFASPSPVAGAGGSVLSHTHFSGAVANLSAQRDWASVRYDLDPVTLSVRTAGSQGDAFSAAALTVDFAGQQLGIEIGNGREDGRALGSHLAGRFGAPDESSSDFTAALWSGPLAFGWRGAARYEHVEARLGMPGFLTIEEEVRASAWSVGVDRPVGPGRLGFTLSQPLRVEAGAVSARVPVEVDRRNRTRYERRLAALSPSGRELSLESAYSFALGERTRASLAARYTTDPGHVAGSDDAVSVWFGLRTGW
ncbi:S8 family peptidase [Marinicauda algicola]|uniref:S8 family peptidase n=1 Tax=Marinicauda algicola TaxID=2029849 RepID=UPI0019D1EA37|nr:S8 family peptidase [Marinicauda algicola]